MLPTPAPTCRKKYNRIALLSISNLRSLFSHPTSTRTHIRVSSYLSTTFPPAHTLISSPHACIHVTLHSSNFCQAPKLGTYHITRCKSRITQISLSYVEVVVLLTIVAAFIYVGCLCNKHFVDILQNLESIQKVFHALDARVAQVRSEVAAANSRHLRRRYLMTVAAVFVTFVLRSVFSLMLATNATAGV